MARPQATSAGGSPHIKPTVKIASSDSWLATVVPQLTADGATVVITFDEGNSSELFTVVAGTGVTNGSSFTTATNHYGLLAGIEKALGLSLLGKAATTPAVPIP